MTAFDTDVLSELLLLNPKHLQRAAGIPLNEQRMPIVSMEEVLRGRLDAIRKAQAGKLRISVALAYKHLQEALIRTRSYDILPYTAAADQEFQNLRAAKVKIGSQDLRIACIAIVHGAKLVTRNARDFQQVPGLNLEVWN